MLNIDEVVSGAITAALWADCQPMDSPENRANGLWDEEDGPMESGGLERLDMDTDGQTKMREIVQQFLDKVPSEWADLYVEACEDGMHATYNGTGPSEQFGHDLYLTAAGYGISFRDRALGDLGDLLDTTASQHASDLEDLYIYQIDEDTATC